MRNLHGKSVLPYAWIILLGILAALIVFLPRQPSPTDKKTVSVPITFSTTEILIDEASQERRRRFIESLERHRFIEEIRVEDGVPVIYPGETFAMTPDHRKATNLGSVFGYHWVLNNQVTHLVIRDTATNRDIGRFSEAGLELFDLPKPRRVPDKLEPISH